MYMRSHNENNVDKSSYSFHSENEQIFEVSSGDGTFPTPICSEELLYESSCSDEVDKRNLKICTSPNDSLSIIKSFHSLIEADSSYTKSDVSPTLKTSPESSVNLIADGDVGSEMSAEVSKMYSEDVLNSRYLMESSIWKLSGSESGEDIGHISDTKNYNERALSRMSIDEIEMENSNIQLPRSVKHLAVREVSFVCKQFPIILKTSSARLEEKLSFENIEVNHKILSKKFDEFETSSSFKEVQNVDTLKIKPEMPSYGNQELYNTGSIDNPLCRQVEEVGNICKEAPICHQRNEQIDEKDPEILKNFKERIRLFNGTFEYQEDKGYLKKSLKNLGINSKENSVLNGYSEDHGVDSEIILEESSSRIDTRKYMSVKERIGLFTEQSSKPETPPILVESSYNSQKSAKEEGHTEELLPKEGSDADIEKSVWQRLEHLQQDLPRLRMELEEAKMKNMELALDNWRLLNRLGSQTGLWAPDVERPLVMPSISEYQSMLDEVDLQCSAELGNIQSALGTLERLRSSPHLGWPLDSGLSAVHRRDFLMEVTGEVDKRSISTLARTGQLPGKRYVAALAKNGEYPRPSWNKKYTSLEELAEEEDPYTKRFLGALARSGDLRGREDKRGSDVDGIIRDMETADTLRRLRLDALKEELIKDGVEEDPDDEKRSMASIARGGGMPGKRSVEALARIGLLKPITTTHDFTEDMNDYEKKISSDEFEDDKRGISSLARNGWNNKRTVDEELEELMNEVYGIGEKRNVASLARGFNLPSNGKRSEEDDKRSISSVMRDRTGKRDGYTNNAIPFVNDDKRNIGALAKNRDFPYAYRFGKREISEEETDEVKKRYVATLLRDGRLPVGPDANNSNQDESQAKEDDAAAEGRDDQSLNSEEKTSSPRSKKDVSEEESHARRKRETFIAPIKDELTAPSGDIEFSGLIGGGSKWADESSPLNRRYFAARGGGKMPGGRLPKVGTRRRSRHENSGRRRN